MESFENNPENDRQRDAACEAELAPHREAIDAVDRQLVTLINQRAAAALEIGRIKVKYNKPIFVGHREKDVLDKVRATNEGGIVPAEDIVTLFQDVMKTSRAAQQRLQDEGWPEA